MKHPTQKQPGSSLSRPFRSPMGVFMLFLQSILMMGLFVNLGHSAEVVLTWNSVKGVDGYRVYYGSESGQYPNIEDVGNCTLHMIQLEPGTYFFSVTAYNRFGESGFSKEVLATIPHAPFEVNLVSYPADFQLEGQSITFTAETTGGCDDYEYQFFVKPPFGSWEMIQGYSPSNSLILESTGLAGAVELQVWARDARSEASFQAYDSLEYLIIPQWNDEVYHVPTVPY